MKKYLLLLLVPVLAFTIPADWVSVNLDEKASIEFPVAPVEKESGGNKVWVADSEKGTRCMVMVMDFSRFGLDSAGVAAEMEKPESFDAFGNSLTQQIEGSSIITKKKGKTKGYTSFEYMIDMGKTDTAALSLMYTQNLFAGSKMYSMSFYEKKGQPNEALRIRFFNSFKVK